MTRTRRVLVGVDTHTAVHCAVVLDQTGRLLGTQEFAASAVGYGQLLRWAGRSARWKRLASKAPVPMVRGWLATLPTRG